jgi:molecular chaperone HtpG
MIQESPVLAAIKKGVTSRILSALEKMAEGEAETFSKVWDLFGPILKEGIYDDFERRSQLLKLSRFRSTASSEATRSLADYLTSMKEGQSAIYYISGSNLDQLKSSPHLEGFRAKGIEVLLLTDGVDSFWPPSAPDFEGKPFKSVTQGLADLNAVTGDGGTDEAGRQASPEVGAFIDFARSVLGDEVDDVRVSDRLTESAVCLVASEHGPDRQLEKLLQGAGRLQTASKPILEINATSERVASIASINDKSFREDAAWLLLDEARILDGDKPANPRAFADRQARLFGRAIGHGN